MFTLDTPDIDKAGGKTYDQVLDQKLEEITIEQGAKAAIEYLKIQNKGRLLSGLTTKINNINTLGRIYHVYDEFLNANDLKYEIESFKVNPAILDWYENHRFSKTLILVGPAGFGKTQLILTLLVKKYGLKGFNPY